MNGSWVEYSMSVDLCLSLLLSKTAIPKKGSLTESQLTNGTFVQTKLSDLIKKNVFLETNECGLGSSPRALQ